MANGKLKDFKGKIYLYSFLTELSLDIRGKIQ